MNRILLKKIKNALKTDYPVDGIREIISEYDEIFRLSIWKDRIIKNGDNLERHEDEFKRIGELIEGSGYYSSMCDDDILTDLRKYFREI